MLTTKPILIEGDTAVLVVDVLGTALLLRQASKAAADAAKVEGADCFYMGPRSPYQRRLRAESYVRELTGLIFSRARSAAMDGAELLQLANDVLSGRARLPEGLEPAEAA